MTMRAIKSPMTMKWNRRQRAERKGGVSKGYQNNKKILMNHKHKNDGYSAVGDHDLVPTYPSETNTSCDATDFLSSPTAPTSVGAPKTGDKSQRASVDAPGWVHNTYDSAQVVAPKVSTGYWPRGRPEHSSGSCKEPSSGPRPMWRIRSVVSSDSAQTPAPRSTRSHKAFPERPPETTRNVSPGSCLTDQSRSAIASNSAQTAPFQILSSHSASPKWLQESTDNASIVSSSSTRQSCRSSTSESVHKVVPTPKIVDSHRGSRNWHLESEENASREPAWSKGRGFGNTDSGSTPTTVPQTFRVQRPPESMSTVARYLSSDAPRGEARRSLYKAIATTSSLAAHHQRGDTAERENGSQPPLKSTIERERCSSESSIERDMFGLVSKFSSSGSDSMPPPGFGLPRKEIRDAIKYHHELGRKLSKLALDKELNDGKSDILHSVASMDSTIASAVGSSHLVGLEYASSIDSVCRLGASNAGPSYKPENGGSIIQPLVHFASKNCVTKHDSQNMYSGLERLSSLESDTSSLAYSSKSNSDKWHLQSFLESHISKRFAASPTNTEFSPNNSISVTRDPTSITPMPPNETFFPRVDDLISPPMSTSSSYVNRDETATTNTSENGKTFTKNSDSLTHTCMASPPRTPSGALNIGGVDRVVCAGYGQEINGSDDTVAHEVLDKDKDFTEALIRSETDSMMLEIKDRIRSDVQQTMDKEMEQHRHTLKSTVTEMSEILEKAVWNIKENECPQSLSSAPSNATDSGNLLKQLKQSFLSMEASIMTKINTQMDTDALKQRQAIEKIIEQKVSKVIAGSGLELKLAVQEVKKESERVSKITLRERTPSPHVRTPPRIKSERRSSHLNSGCTRPSPVSGGRRSNITDNAQFCAGSYFTEKDMAGDPEKKSLEDSFAETMRVIDDFVDDCDEIANGFDKIVNRMQDSDVTSDLDDW